MAVTPPVYSRKCWGTEGGRTPGGVLPGCSWCSPRPPPAGPAAAGGRTRTPAGCMSPWFPSSNLWTRVQCEEWRSYLEICIENRHSLCNRGLQIDWNIWCQGSYLARWTRIHGHISSQPPSSSAGLRQPDKVFRPATQNPSLVVKKTMYMIFILKKLTYQRHKHYGTLDRIIDIIAL